MFWFAIVFVVLFSSVGGFSGFGVFFPMRVLWIHVWDHERWGWTFSLVDYLNVLVLMGVITLNYLVIIMMMKNIGENMFANVI